MNRMPVSFKLSNLINGVSQQAPQVRRDSQASEQVNCVSSPLFGLKRRPPTEHLSRLTDANLESTYTHVIDRGTGERYVVSIGNGTVRVFDTDGVERTVYAPNGLGYLSFAAAREQVSCVTVADYTFIVNKTKAVSQSSTTSPYRPPEALINVKQGNYGKTYSVAIDALTVASYTTPDGSQPGHSANISTDYIASILVGQLVKVANLSVSQHGSTIYVKRTNNADFSISVKDGFNGNAMLAIKGSTQRFSDLPSSGPNGIVVEVAGDNNNGFDNYFVKLESSNGVTGVWKETVKPNIHSGFDASTMPHVLISNADGTFTFKQAVWNGRVAGDEDSAPMPTFVGRTITDVFFFRNRLSFLSDEAVILSEAGQYFNFFPTTVTTMVDSDPIDVGSNHVKVSLLKHAVPFSKKLIAFSDSSQFVIEGRDILSASTITMLPVSEYDSSTKVKPVVAGGSLYFACERGQYDAIREMIPTDIDGAYMAADITAHVPYYIPSPVTRLVAMPNEDTLVALSDAEPQSLFVYKWTLIGNEKAQSSWSKWEFDDVGVILDIAAVDSDLFIIIQRGDGVFLERMNMGEGTHDANVSHLVHLDRRVTMGDCEVTYSDLKNLTTIRFPYTPGLVPKAVYDFSDATPVSLRGTVVPLTPAGGDLFTTPGDLRGASLFLGINYTSSYTFSPQYVHSGNASITSAEFRVTRLLLSMQETGKFNVLIKPIGRDVYTGEFAGVTVDGLGAHLSEPTLFDGEFSVPLTGRGGETEVSIVSIGPNPFHFPQAEIEGRMTIRSRRI